MTDTQPVAASAGALLRAAREKQGLHIAALAAAIKVAPRKLDALESDRWQDLPDATFTRALAQTVCRTLKIDARPILALLPAAPVAALAPLGNTMNEPFRDRSARDTSGFGTAAIRPMVWAAAVLMGAALLVYFVPPDLWAVRPAAPAASAVSTIVLPPPVPASESAPTPTQSAAAASVAAASAPADPASAAAGPVAAAAASGAAVAPAQASTGGETVFSAPAGASASVPAAAGLVQLSSTEASWVEVRDARGNVLLSRTVQPGESVGLNGSLPIRMTIGNAVGTQVQFRGQPVDLASRTRDNVARVELQ